MKDLAKWTILVVAVLPTQACGPKKAPLVDDSHFNSAMYHYVDTISDAYLAAMLAEEEQAVSPNKIPSESARELNRRLGALEQSESYLASSHFADPVREGVRNQLVSRWAKSEANFEYVRTAQQIAIKDKSWSQGAKEQLKMAHDAFNRESIGLFLEPVKVFAKTNQQFREGCSPRNFLFLGFQPEIDFGLGFISFSDKSDLTFSICERGTLVEFLGFKTGDVLQSFNGEAISTLYDLYKAFIKSAGKKAYAGVIRDGKVIRLDFKVPDDIRNPDFHPATTASTKTFIQSLCDNKLLRTWLTADFNGKFTKEREKQIVDELRTLGKLTSIKSVHANIDSKILYFEYALTFEHGATPFALWVDHKGLIISFSFQSNENIQTKSP